MERTSATATTQGQNIYSGVNNTNNTNNASSYPSSNSPNAVMYGGSSSNGGTPSSPSAAMYASPAHASSNQAIRQQPQQAQGTAQQNLNQAQPSTSFNAYGSAAPTGATGSGFFYSAPSAQAAGTQSMYAANPSAAAAAVFPMRGAPGQAAPNQMLTPAAAAAAWTSATANINAGSKLFVGQVPAVCTEDQLRPIFAQFGPLLEIKIMREPNGRSKGSAWVRYETEESAQRAINALNEKHVVPPQTNPLRVQFAAPSSNRMAPSSQSQSFSTIGSIMPSSGTAQQQPNYAAAATYATPQGYPGATTAYMQGQYASPNLMAMRTAPQQTTPQQQAGASGKLEYLRTNQPGGVIYSTASPTGVAQAPQQRPQQQSPQQQQVVYAAGGQMRAGVMYTPDAFTMTNQMTTSPQQQQQQQQQHHQWCT